MGRIDYSRAKDWILAETVFNEELLGKCEAVFSLGNGYLGLRSATEEKYINEQRDLFVAGTFNKFDDNEVTELPNAADVLEMNIVLNGSTFDLTKGTITSYDRTLNIKTGELCRDISWTNENGDEYLFAFRRIVSKNRLHIIAQRVEITSKSTDSSLVLKTGINGRMTNSGSQHFSEGEKRLFDQKYMQYNQKTSESGIDFVFTTGINFLDLNNATMDCKSRIIMDRRKIETEYQIVLKQNETLVIEKISDVRTSRDKTAIDTTIKQLQEASLQGCKEALTLGYNQLLIESAQEWKNTVWDKSPINICSKNEEDQLAINFAQYHLHVMVPKHDNRMNIAAKGLSGEGYKGHTFWDTEIFILPYFTFNYPEIARSLEEYRYLSLSGAHKKASENGYYGAQFPWESAWLDDGEVTPVWGAADIITGLPTKIWSGFIEQHITCDVAFGVWQYYMVTGDQDYMDKYGYELMLDTAKFWSSRLEYDTADQLYHINEVVGPDEYKEHVDDNAFTNYMAHWNICKAIEYTDELKETKVELYQSLCNKLDLEKVYEEWTQKVDKIYLPTPREDLLVAQDSKYLTYDNIDLTPYKNQEHVGLLFHDYNLEQVNKLQVSKQADIMLLFLLKEELFDLEVKKANWNYYEPRTLHDSSLSLSTHSILANDMNEQTMAYDMFVRARNIDMGPNMKSSNDGIHAASIGGVWQCTVFGFGGVRMINGELRIEPKLPNEWDSLDFQIMWRGQKLKVDITKSKLVIVNLTNTSEVEFNHKGKKYTFTDEISIEL